MDDVRNVALSYLGAIWRRRWIAALICWAICGVGWAGVALIPDKYESQARIYVNSDTLLQPLLRGLAIDTDPIRQVEYLQRTLLSRPNLEQLIHLADLEAKARTPGDKEALLRSLESDIKIAQQTQSLFTITYQSPNPIVAQKVVQGMMTIFSEASAGNSRTEMDNAQRFLTEQITKYEAQLKAAEERRAAFREKYAEILPDISNGGSRLDAARMAVRQAQLQLDDAKAKRDALRKEITSVPQLLNVDQAASVVIADGRPAPTSPRARLAEAQQQLDALLLQDTEQHPDVIAARHRIAALKAEIEAEDKASKSGQSSGSNDARHATVSNPVYEQLKLRLADADGTVASLEQALNAAQAEKARMENLVRQAPGVEQQAQSLDRDYDVLKKNYEELISRREATHIAEAADTQADKIQFRVVDAPQVPLKPAAPNRPLLFSGVLIVGIAGGIGVAFLLAQLDRSFTSLAALARLGLPILGSVSWVDLLDSRRRHVMQIAGIGASFVVLLIVYGALVAVSLKLYQGVL